MGLMNRMNTKTRAQVIRCIVEGNSIRSTERITGVTKKAITRLIVDMGDVCQRYQDRALRNLQCKRLQLDEIWSFCYAKEKKATPEMRRKHGAGDVWTWTAIDADTKLIPNWLVGGRDAGYATEFVQDLAGRLANRVQLTSDGLKVYLEAVEDAFGADVDYAMLVKHYGNAPEGEKRYSPAVCTGATQRAIMGNPDATHISTSYVERHNLTIRMQNRRYTRLTNAFSKKLSNHIAAFSLFIMYYNFGRVHQTLRVTPAMEAGVSDHVWTIEEMVQLLEAEEARRPQKRGPYMKWAKVGVALNVPTHCVTSPLPGRKRYVGVRAVRL